MVCFDHIQKNKEKRSKPCAAKIFNVFICRVYFRVCRKSNAILLFPLRKREKIRYKNEWDEVKPSLIINILQNKVSSFAKNTLQFKRLIFNVLK